MFNYGLDSEKKKFPSLFVLCEKFMDLLNDKKAFSLV